eukprot:scaffold23658_cov97-Isochrysis_galbana.AAC.1
MGHGVAPSPSPGCSVPSVGWCAASDAAKIETLRTTSGDSAGHPVTKDPSALTPGAERSGAQRGVLRHPRVSLLHSRPFVEANFLCAQTARAAARPVCAQGMCRQACRHAFALAIVPALSSRLRLQRGPAWRRSPRSGPPLSAGYQGGGAPS